MRKSPLTRKTPLRRKTPLKAVSGFKPRQPLEWEGKASQPEETGVSPAEGPERRKSAKKRPKTSLETHLDIVFSLYIRLRDAMDGGWTKCISCGRVFPFTQIQCGHFFGRSNMATRWDEHNCNAECAECNCCDDDHLVGYELNLIKKIGEDSFESLCERARGMRKWSGDELREMVRHYTAEARKLGREKGISVKI